MTMPASAPPGDVSWQPDLSALWRRKSVILAITAVTIACGVASLFAFPELHEVRTRLYLRKSGNPIKGSESDGPEDRYFLGTQAEILRSPLIVRRALSQAPVSLPPNADGDLMAYVLESLTVAPIVNTHVLGIRFGARDPGEALRFVDALIGSYQEYLRSNDANSSTEVVKLLTRREEELRNKLDGLGKKYAVFRSQSPLIGTAADRLEASTAILGAMARALAESQSRRVAIETKLSAVTDGGASKSALAQSSFLDSSATHGTSSTGPSNIKLALATNAPDAPVGQGQGTLTALSPAPPVDSLELADVDRQLLLAQYAQQRIERRLGGAHRGAEEAAAQVELLTNMRDALLHASIDALKSQASVEAATEAGLQKLYDQEKKNAKALDEHIVRDDVMTSEIARTEGAYNAVFTQLTDMQLVEKALSSGGASVVVRDLDGEDRNAELVWPRPRIVLPACLMLGLVFGSLFVIVVDSAGRTARATAQ